MTKFKVEVELQGYKVELGALKVSIEGTTEDAPRIAQQIEKQLAVMLQPPAMISATALPAAPNGKPTPLVIDAIETGSNGAGKKKAKKSGGGGTKSAADELTFVHDSAKYGTPQQAWTTAQKAIWFLYIASEQPKVCELTAYSLAKNFNKYFRASKAINSGNVMKALDKEKLKGANSTVGAAITDGTTKYFLTHAGIAFAQRLTKGEAIAD